MGIADMLHQALDKIVMRAVGYQTETACGNLQLYAGIEPGIEGATHAVGKRRLEKERKRRSKEEARIPDEEEDEDEVAGAERLRVETEGTEEEAAEIL